MRIVNARASRSAGALIAFVLSAACAEAAIVDGIVATVDVEIILQSELMAEIAPALSSLQASASSAEEFNRLAEEQVRAALEQAIDNKILLRQALMAGLEVNEDAVEERIGEIRKRYPSNETLLKELENAGMTMSDFREHVRKQILAISMGIRKRREFEKAVQVSESEVAQHYQDNLDEFTHPERVRVLRIFLKAGPDTEERARAKARLEQLKEELEAGADFAQLAASYSDGPEAAEEGMFGWVSPGDLVESLEQAVFSLPAGGVSDLLETEYGFHLFKIEGKEEAGTAGLDDVRAQIERELRAQQAARQYERWITELRKRSRVRIYL